MKVKLCEDGGHNYYVYQLPDVDSCPVAYCAGECQPETERWDHERDQCVSLGEFYFDFRLISIMNTLL